MKKVLFCLFAALVCAGVFSQEPIAVFPFEDVSNVLNQTEMTFFYRQFSNEFTNRNNGRFDVLPRVNVDRLFDTEAAFQLSDFSSREKTAEMNRALNGRQILSGVIGRRGNSIRISISLFTYPDFVQLPGGIDEDAANADALFAKIPELVQSMMTAIAGGGTDVRPNPPGQPLISTNVPANFVRVEGGSFQMGSTVDDSEMPIHTVTVKSFSMGKYPVTQKEYQEVMGTNPSYFKGDNRPVERVSWYDAVEYCNRLSQKEGLSPAYTINGTSVTWNRNANGYRLPTEAEWEYAAKGGNGSPGNYTYSGSNNVDEVAWYENNSAGSTQDVGTKKPNNLGLYDMSGNVSEWCWDWYGNYSSGSQTDPVGAASGASRVARGGSCNNNGQYQRSDFRDGLFPSFTGFSTGGGFGFRLVRG